MSTIRFLSESWLISTKNLGVLSMVSFCLSNTIRFSITTYLNGFIYIPVKEIVVLSSLDKYAAAFLATKVWMGLNWIAKRMTPASNNTDVTIQRSIFNSFLIIL